MPHTLYRFGPFELDTGERMLMRDGCYVPLTPKAFSTLAVLVERSGRIVEKEELFSRVWPDTFVEDVSLAKNVSTLRKALGESGENRYIQTVPKRGYRFIADVSLFEQRAQPGFECAPAPVAAGLEDIPVQRPAAPPAVRLRWPLWQTLSLLATLCALSIAFFNFKMVKRASADAAPLRTFPITSFQGQQSQAAFAPGGDEVAFVSTSPELTDQHLYKKRIGSEAVVQLTRATGTDSKPAWLPNGRYISFVRSTPGRRAWYLVPSSGGPERKLVDVFPYFHLGPGNSPYISPDGRFMAFTDKLSALDPSAIYLLQLETLNKTRITSPPSGTTGDYDPAFSPDGKLLAFARATSFSAMDVYVRRLGDGAPRRLTFDNLEVDGIAWSEDGRDIVFSSTRGGSTNSLWRIPASGGTPERIAAVGENALSPAMAINGNIAFTRALDDMNIWSIDLDMTGREIARRPLIASIFRDSDPDYSPDGKKIAFTSGRAGAFGIWVSNSDGTNARILFDGGAYVTGTPRWSPDGRWIAFDSRAGHASESGRPSIYVIPADRGPARLVVRDAVAPSWSHDGHWIYFASSRTGALQIWKVACTGGVSAQLTRNGGFEAFESASGKDLYYVKGRGIPGLWRVSVNGGAETPVSDCDQVGLWRSWRVVGDNVYFATSALPRGPRLEALDLQTGAVRLIGPLNRPPEVTIPGLAVSPSGRRILYAEDDQGGSNIMMIKGAPR